MTPEQKYELLKANPGAKKFVKSYVGAQEFLNRIERWCLWLKDITATELQELPLVKSRVREVQEFRLKSTALTTREYAKYPTQFRQIVEQGKSFILVPRHSSESRRYIPFAFLDDRFIASDACFVIPDATLFQFGVISTSLHMAWVRAFCGRIKSDFRYSKTTVYNNFPWPEEPTAAKRTAVEQAAKRVLDARAEFPDSTLADLYDPLTMPRSLVQAHNQLDRAVEKCYRTAAFSSERQRVEFLFERYQQLTAPLLGTPRRRR